MAGLLETRMQELRPQLSAIDKNMTRACEYGALNFFIDQTNAPDSIVSKEWFERVFATMGREVKIPVIKYDGSVSVTNTRSCVESGAGNTSALMAVTFKTYAVGFSMVPAQYSNNDISYQHDFLRNMEKVSRALAAELDKDALAALEANKTQVFAETLNYTESGDVVQVPWEMRETVLGDMNPLMRANCYNGMIHVIGNAGADSLLRILNQYGEFNEVDRRLQFADKVLHFTNSLTNGGQKYATMYAVENGNVAMFTRVDREALAGTKLANDEWGVTRLPFINHAVGYHLRREVGDQSAVSGAATADLTCAVKESYTFSVDVAYVVAYNSDPATVASPIMKFEVAKSGANPAARPVIIVNSEESPVFTKAVAG